MIKMIISASRRTDIPALYSDWFFKRIKEGYVLVKNPMNVRQVSKVSLKREAVDCIVFWTKNPYNMLPKLDLIKDYQYYFQFTLNPYNNAIETNLRSKSVIIDTFKRLSDKIGPDRVIWRYDPIILNADLNINYHEKFFEILAKGLEGYTSRCVISFIDYYRKIDKNLKKYDIYEIDDTKKRVLAEKIVNIAKAYSIKIETCAEEIDLDDLGIEHARCIDPFLIESLLGMKTKLKKDLNQRKACGCITSVDIGAYNTCTHGCIYCYANYSSKSVKRNMDNYDINSPLLCSRLDENDRIVEKNIGSSVVP